MAQPDGTHSSIRVFLRGKSSTHATATSATATPPLPAPLDGKSIDWKRNLAVVWLTQFVSIAAFSFTLPLVPIYLRETELVPPDRVYDYAAWFQTSASFALMIMSPIWGALGDRYGRKMMLVRANLGGAFALYAMGVVGSIEALLALRLFQGAFTGTTPAAQTLVSAYTPPKHQALALGLMAAAIALGDLFGRALGGEVAALWGVPFAFQISGILLYLSTILVWVFVKEKFVPPTREPAATASGRFHVRRRFGRWLGSLSGVMPLMGTFIALAFFMTLDGTMFSLYIDEIGVHLPDTANLEPQEYKQWVYRISSRLLAVAGISSALASLTTGWILDRWRGSWYIGCTGVGLALALFGTGMCLTLPEWLGWTDGASATAWTLSLLFGLRLLLGFCFAALNSSQLVWVGRGSNPEQRGALFGLSATARSVGWMLGPLVSAWIANRWGIRTVFLVGGAGIFLLAPAMVAMSIKYHVRPGKGS